ncbi:hypothetical protein PISL3812_03057 [Talaromyces islandicus]|uniref:Uncharacterized protein n=1 Tax=Talaromyces islandicus TaxID=28573 RepID=A0A0U1LRM7_TALIS|nr:hypothetical protein PISL3812_03057 [Talaromyces islandicus]
MSHAEPPDLDSRRRLLQQIETIDDLTEQRILTLRALTFSNIHLPWLNVDNQTFVKWSSKMRPEMETIIEYDASSNCVMIKGRSYMLSNAITMAFNHLFYEITRSQGQQNFDFYPTMPMKRFKFIGQYENTQLVPDAYLKAKNDPYPRHVILLGPFNSIRNVTAAARHWILSTAGVTKTATIFVIHLDRPPLPMSVLINSPAFQENYGLLEDEVRSVYGNIPDLATHILNWYFDTTPLKLGGEYICRIITFDQENINGKRPVATLKFSAQECEISDVSTRDQSGAPIFELEGQILNLNELILLLHHRASSEANSIAIDLARLKLSQLGILQDQGLRRDAKFHDHLTPGYPGRFSNEEFERTFTGRR